MRILVLPIESLYTHNVAADGERLNGLNNLNVGLILPRFIPEPGTNVLQASVTHFFLVGSSSIDPMLENKLAVG